MHKITVEAALRQMLGAMAGQAVLCDASGHALGFFSPLQDRPHVEDLQLEPPLSIAETEELRKSRTGKPLGEILGGLGLP
jgi:hypothetical protein